MQSATPPEKHTRRTRRGGTNQELPGVLTWRSSSSSGFSPRARASRSAIRSVIFRKVGRLVRPPAASSNSRSAATAAAAGEMDWTVRSSPRRMSRPPTSRQPVETVSPQSKATMLVVPPPMSRFTATQSSSRLHRQAPEPFPAMMDSRSGPAVETTKSPAKPLSSESTAAAFSFRADSPVMITAPVSTSAGRKPARPYSRATISRTPAPSMRTGLFRGVVWTCPL